MTIEQVEMRKVISQMLADQGINQTTLKNMVKSVVDEKIDKAVRYAVAEIDVNKKVADYFSTPQLRREITNAIKEKANGLINNVNVYVSMSE